jgi:hypothetical protein
MSGQAQGPDDVTLVQVLGDLVDPSGAVLFRPALEQLPQRHDQLSGRFVPSHVRTAHKGTEVAHSQVVAGFDRCLGPVTPFGGLDARDERFGDRKHALCTGLGTALFASAFPLEVQGRADSRYTASKELLGDGLLLGGQAIEHRVAVSVAGVEPALALS